MNDDLKTQRGFGLLDPVPVAVLSGTEGKEVFEFLPPQLETQMFSPDLTVSCPRAPFGMWSTVECRSCHRFAGLGHVEIHGKPDSPEKEFRILCRYPLPRPLTPAGGLLDTEYRDRLLAAILSGKDVPETDQEKRELNVFVHQRHAMNCPISRAKTRVWRVIGPPCPLCENYKGLTRVNDQDAALCAHRAAREMRPVIDGSKVM